MYFQSNALSITSTDFYTTDTDYISQRIKLSLELDLNMNWVCKNFVALSLDEVYAILQLRSEVFVVEQHCYYQDLDGKDQTSFHLMCFENRRLIAYARLLPMGATYKHQSIGRVVVKRTERASGLGKMLMQQAIQKSYELFGCNPIMIGAQYHLKRFYQSFGFEQCSNIYDDAGIDHIEMLKVNTL